MDGRVRRANEMSEVSCNFYIEPEAALFLASIDACPETPANIGDSGGVNALPAAVDKTFQRAVIRFVGHLATVLDPVAQIQMRQA